MTDTLVRSIIRVVVVFATFAAAYLFIIRPIVSTTDKAFDLGSGITDQINRSLDDADITSVDVDKIERQSARLQSQLKTPKQAQRVGDCAERFGADVEAILRCAQLGN